MVMMGLVVNLVGVGIRLVGCVVAVKVSVVSCGDVKSLLRLWWMWS